MAVFWKPRDFLKLGTSKKEHCPHNSTFIFRQKIFVSIFCSNFANLQHIRYSFNSVKNHAAVPKSAVLNISIICHGKSLRFIRWLMLGVTAEYPATLYHHCFPLKAKLFPEF